MEDEPPILRSMCQKIEQSGPDFVIVATAQNGREALQHLSEDKIDLVFLDINLPIVSGLDVLEYISVHDLQVMSVVVSGYKNFEYARKACACHAVDYLLKPLQESELHSLLQRIADQFAKKVYINREALFRQALFGHAHDELPHEDYYMLVVQSGAPSHDDVHQTGATIRPWDLVDIGKLIPLIFNNALVSIVDGRTESEKVLLSRDKSLIDIFTVRTFFNSIQVSESQITVMIFNLAIPLNDMKHYYLQAREYLYRNKLFCRSALLVYSGGTVPEVTLSEKMLQFTQSIMHFEGDFSIDKFKGILHKMLNEAIQNQTRHAEIVICLKRFFSALQTKYSSNVACWQSEEELEQILEYGYTYDSTEKLLLQLLEKNFGAICIYSDKAQLALKIRQYIDENYIHDISNKSLSEKFGYVPSYVSMVFKAQYKMSPSEYIIGLRVKQAQVLMKETTLLNREIALKIGYTDPLYFSKVFKKATGESPKQYMERMRSNKN